MRRLIFLMLIVCVTMGHSQSGYKHLNLDVGYNLQGNPSYNLGLEFNKGSFSAWEIAVEYTRSEYDARLDSIGIAERYPDLSADEIQASLEDLDISTTDKEELYLIGVYYKPLIAKKRNLLFNFRYGLLLGRTDNFAFGPGAGFELTYSLPSLFAIFIKQSNHYIINVDDRFRHSINAGIKIPF